MSDFAPTESDLQAWVDGRLPMPRQADVEAWLAARPDEAARLAAYRDNDDALRALHLPVLEEPVPGGLVPQVRARRARVLRIAAACAWVAIGTLGGWQLQRTMHPAEHDAAPAPIARNAAIAHATYSPEVRHPVEVGADQEPHLVAWLSKRLGTAVRAPKLESVGYSLVGGRLLPGDGGPTAQFMYQCKAGTRITLYLRTEAPDHGQTAFRYADEGSVRVFYWIDRTMGYALSSGDISKADLYKVATSVYQQLNP
ncbi:MAG: anti-sigma factor [Proteobacteria bacterium]|nr:anti-sigma factor [Pseudomonadota bacterium]